MWSAVQFNYPGTVSVMNVGTDSKKRKKKKKDNEVAVAYYELNISIIWETL